MRGLKANKVGARKKHRGSGNRGGRGMAGTGKRADHKRMSILKKDPGYFGKYGFNRPAALLNKGSAMNIDQLPREAVVDLGKMGVSKLLGRGTPDMKQEIIVAACSASARKKIEAAGGKIVSGGGMKRNSAAGQKPTPGPEQTAEKPEKR